MSDQLNHNHYQESHSERVAHSKEHGRLEKGKYIQVDVFPSEPNDTDGFDHSKSRLHRLIYGDFFDGIE